MDRQSDGTTNSSVQLKDTFEKKTEELSMLEDANAKLNTMKSYTIQPLICFNAPD